MRDQMYLYNDVMFIIYCNSSNNLDCSIYLKFLCHVELYCLLFIKFPSNIMTNKKGLVVCDNELPEH